MRCDSRDKIGLVLDFQTDNPSRYTEDRLVNDR